MQIVEMKIDELIPYANNPRNNDDAVDFVANSIREFGFKVPIVIDSNNEIIAGHTRLKAAKKLGLTEVPCIVADDLSSEQIRAFRLADNKVGEIATWDMELLISELELIDEIDMETMGFDELDTVDIGDYPSTDFELPDGDKTGYEQISFTFTQAQKRLIVECLELVGDVDLSEGGKKLGTKLYEVCRQWMEQREGLQI